MASSFACRGRRSGGIPLRQGEADVRILPGNAAGQSGDPYGQAMGHRCPITQPNLFCGGHLVGRQAQRTAVLVEKVPFTAASIVDRHRPLQEVARSSDQFPRRTICQSRKPTSSSGST